MRSMDFTTAEPFTYASARPVAGFLRTAIGELELWLERHKQRRALLGLNDALLKDIGVSRTDAYREGTKHFWQA